MSIVLDTDYHCHCLPNMDDGASSSIEASTILESLYEQGVQKVVCTPHYYPHHESVLNFLTRRQAAYDTLQKLNQPKPIIYLGAEVKIEKNISGIEELIHLTWGNSKYILLELPYGEYKEWMPEEICNIVFQLGVTPVIAHFERYLSWYKHAQISEILSIPDVIIQLNNDALFRYKTLRFSMSLIKNNYKVLFGSDSHNTTKRIPNFDQAKNILNKKLDINCQKKISHFANTLLESDPS